MEGFPLLHAIFYSEFHPTQGPKVVFEVPEGFVYSAVAAAAGAASLSSSQIMASPEAPNVQPMPVDADTLASSSVLSSSSSSPMSDAFGMPVVQVPNLSPSVSGLGDAADDGRDASDPVAASAAAATLAAARSDLVNPSLAISQNANTSGGILGSAWTAPHVSASVFATVRPSPFSVAELSEPILDFDAVSEYIIPKSDLCNRLVTISTPFYKIVGHPVAIQNTKYERNALIFNVCFVFEKSASTACYEQVVSKTARVLRSLEIESGFLSNPSTKAGVLNIIEQLLEDLNSYNECQIPIDDANTINLKLFPHYPVPPPVNDYQVPVPVLDLTALVDKYWDMTMRRIIPFVNGVHSVRRIADMADVETALVRLAVQHLLYYGCVRLVDIFQFSNMYSVTSNIASLLASTSSQTDCIQFVRKPNASMPSFGTVFALYCSLKGGVRLNDWVLDNRQMLKPIDVRRFIIFGLLRGILYRVHKYPVISPATVGSGATVDPSVARFARLLDGQHHIDDLCTRLQCSAKELEDRLDSAGVFCIMR